MKEISLFYFGLTYLSPLLCKVYFLTQIRFLKWFLKECWVGRVSAASLVWICVDVCSCTVCDRWPLTSWTFSCFLLTGKNKFSQGLKQLTKTNSNYSSLISQLHSTLSMSYSPYKRRWIILCNGPCTWICAWNNLFSCLLRTLAKHYLPKVFLSL